MDISFVTRKFQRSIAGLGLATILATSVFTGTAFGMTFDDVDSDYFAYDQIDALSDAGVMTGYEGTNNFGPDDYLTREQAAKVLVMAFATVDTSASVTCTGEVSEWAVDYVATANQLGIMEGDDEGNCNASDNILRAEFAKMAISASGLSNDGTMASDWFDDVVAGAWYDEYMGTAYVYGVMSGYENGDMGPGDNVTRGQAAKMTYNAQNPVYNPPSTGDDDDDDDVVTGGGSLEIILASDSPEDYTYFSAGTNAEVASFEVTASDEDVLVTSFEVELASGDADSITALALYSEEGTRISKVDTSIDSDDIARLTMLNGGYTVAAGTSETFRLMNTFDTVAGGANTSTLYSYSFDSSMIESDAGTVEVENDLTTGIFGLLDNNTGAITVDDVDAATDVQVGETDAELFSFEVDETSEDKDVWVTGFTFENTGTANLDEALSDLALYFDGDWVADGTQNGDYISFQMDSDMAPLVEAGNTESFEVRAAVIGESTETLIFGIEETLDVRAVDEDDNDVAVTSTFAVATTTIEAGAISVVAYDAESDKFRADREDVELGRFEVTPGTDGMELISLNLDLEFTAEEDDNAEIWYVSDLFENFKVELNGTNYSLDLGTAGVTEVYSADIDKTLVEGTVYEFVVYADTVTTTAAAATATASARDGVTYDVDSLTNFTVEMSMDDLGTGATTDGIVVEESVSGDQVTDFTPSTVSFNSLQGETAGVEFNGLSLSSAKNVVVGAEELLLEFQVEEAADVSDLTIKDFNVNILVDEDADAAFAEDATEAADNSNIASVDLYQVASDDTETLVDSVSGSSLGSTTVSEGTLVNLDFSDITVAQNSEETFRVYVTFVDDEALNADTFKAVVSSYDVRDDDNNNVYDSGDTTPFGDFTDDTEPTSGRTITLVSTGALYVEVDNDDSTYGTQSKRFIQNGATDAGILTLALRSTNENVTVEDYTLTLSAGSIKEMFTDFYIYDENGVLVGSKTVTTETTSISFTDVGTELTAYADVTTRYYVLADATVYGLNEIGTADALTVASRTWTMAATSVKGDDSNNTLAINDNGGDATLESGEIGYGSTTSGARAGDDGATATDASEGFGMAATLISEVELVDSYDGISVATSLNNGSNNVAIIAVTVDDTLNSESTGDDVKVDLDVLVAQYVALTGVDATTVNSTSIERIGGTEGAIAGVNAADAVAQKATFTLTWTTDNLIVPGTTAYFVVKADVTKDVTAENDDYIQFALRDLNSSNTGGAYADNFTWKDFSSATANVAVYMGSTSAIEGDVISE